MKGTRIGSAILAGGRSIITACGVAATLMTVTAAAASGQITFTGFVTYKFDGQSFGATRTIGGLSITQDGFSVTTNTFGYAGIGGTGNSLGRMSLAASPFIYDGHTFEMQLAFTAPTTGNQTFFANVFGSVTDFNGGAHIRFSPAVISGIPFSDGATSGTFDLSVNDVSIFPSYTGVLLTGDITV